MVAGAPGGVGGSCGEGRRGGPSRLSVAARCIPNGRSGGCDGPGGAPNGIAGEAGVREVLEDCDAVLYGTSSTFPRSRLPEGEVALLSALSRIGPGLVDLASLSLLGRRCSVVLDCGETDGLLG